MPETCADAVDERLAVKLYAAAVALLVRLGHDIPAACVAEDILAVALLEQATLQLELTVAQEDVEAGVAALDGIFDLFQDDDVLALFGVREPLDAGLPKNHPVTRGLDVVDQRIDAWF